MSAAMLKPRQSVVSSTRSEFSGITEGLRRLNVSQNVSRQSVVPVEMRRQCQLTGKTANNGFSVSFSHKRNRRLQHVNLQYKRVYWEKGQRWVNMRISTKAMRTIEKKGLDKMAKEAGIDLWKLPFRDARPERIQYLKDHPMEVPMPKNPPNKMKNPERLAASKKTPLVAKYMNGRIYYTRADKFPEEE